MKKNQLFTFTVLISILLVSCQSNEEVTPEMLIPYQTGFEKTLILNVMNTGIAINSVYSDLITDSLERVKFADAMLSHTRFFPDDAGYFFLESLSGYCIIDAAYPTIQGQYRLDETTPDGQFYVREMVDMAQHAGQGWVNYYFTNPTTQKLEKKSGFIKLLPTSQWYIGSGFYASEVTGKADMTMEAYEDFNFQTLVNTMAQSLSGVSLAYNTDTGFITSAYRDMVHHIHFGTDGSGYFFVYTMEGIVVAHGATSTLEGKNLIDYQDAKGNFVIQMLIDKVITDEAGFVDYYWLNPVDEQVEGKRAYVEKIEGTDMFVGSGFYHVTE